MKTLDKLLELVTAVIDMPRAVARFAGVVRALAATVTFWPDATPAYRPPIDAPLLPESHVAARARLAIASATSLEALHEIRRKLYARLRESAITVEQHGELLAMTHERADIFIAGSDGDTEHFDAAEVDAEARA